MARLLKVPRNEAEYRDALEWVEELMDSAPGSPESETLDVLSILIERYEDEHYPIGLPDPISALKFRMEQAGLSQQDLVAYIGSKSKVSEILSGKRELTLAMIRALHRHLGIPAEVLLRDPGSSLPDDHELDFSRFPVVAMNKNGAFGETERSEVHERSEELVRGLISRAGGFDAIPAGVYRKTDGMRVNAKLDHYALLGWSLQVLADASSREPESTFSKGSLTSSFFEHLAGLSVLPEGPKLARTLLAQNGLLLECVPHLAKTYLDGALFRRPDGVPVIALTLRHDRVDNFWLVLFHELGHLFLGHLTEERQFFADDLDLMRETKLNGQEHEADRFAVESLLPTDFDLDRREYVSSAEVVEYARRINRHPGVVAGRIQFVRNDYRKFSRLIGRNMVRRCFAEWRPQWT